MPYVVIEQTETSVSIWDGVTKDKRLKPAGVMEIPMDNTEQFTVGRKVVLAVRLLPLEPTEQEEEDGSGDT